MSERRRLGLVLGGFVVAGLFLLLFGEDGEARLAGAVSVLFFGGGGLFVFGLPLLGRRGATGPRLAHVRGEPAIVFGLGRARVLLAFSGASLMAAAGIGITVAGATLIGVSAVVVFGAFALIALYGLVRARGLALTPTRIVALGYGQGIVAWADVKLVGVLHEGPVSLVAIEAFRVERGIVGRLNRRLSHADLAVPVDDAEAVAGVLIAYLAQPERRPALGTEQELARLSGRA